MMSVNFKSLARIFSIGVVALAFTSAPSVVLAGEYKLESIVGPEVSLSEHSHSFSGHIKDTLVFASFSHDGEGEVSLQMRKLGVLSEVQYSKVNNAFVANFGDSMLRFVNVDFQKSEIVFELTRGGVSETISMGITASAYENRHFIAPTFTFNRGGKSMVLNYSGQACWNYSLHLGMMLLPAMLNEGLL